jgi:hypothetical protein
MIIYILSFFINLVHFLFPVSDAIGVQGPLTFNKTKFELAVSLSPDDGMYVQSYLPKSEVIETYNQKMSILLIDTDKEIEEIVTKKTKDLAELKKLDHNTAFTSREINSGKEYIVEFTTCESEKNKIILVEYNVSKVQRIKTTSGKNAILIYTYTWRSYDDETTHFLATISSFKDEFITEMSSAIVPAVSWR